MKKVLVCCPTADVKSYCFSEWVNNVQNLTYGNYNIHVVDNSDDRDFFDKWKTIIPMSRVSPSNVKSLKQLMALSHEECRKIAIKENYEWMLHWESDILNVPLDIIETLLSKKKKVIGCLYHIEVGNESHLMIQNIENFGDEIRETYNLDIQDISFVDGSVKKVFSCGLGCTLIHRSVFEKVGFRYEEGANVHPDSFFFADLNSIHQEVYVDSSIYLKHDNHTLLRV